MPIKKKRISPRQKMINLMYVVLMAMLALNVSSDVLNGFSLVYDGLQRATENATQTNQGIYATFDAQMEANPANTKRMLKSFINSFIRILSMKHRKQLRK